MTNIIDVDLSEDTGPQDAYNILEDRNWEKIEDHSEWLKGLENGPENEDFTQIEYELEVDGHENVRAMVIFYDQHPGAARSSNQVSIMLEDTYDEDVRENIVTTTKELTEILEGELTRVPTVNISEQEDYPSTKQDALDRYQENGSLI